MKVGDLVMQRAKNEIREQWGVGYIVEIHESKYPNHAPWISVMWPKWHKETLGPMVYLEVISECR